MAFQMRDVFNPFVYNPKRNWKYLIMPAVARLGDPSDHGGKIISASTNVFADGIGVARTGDSHSCPIKGHGITALSSPATVLVNGKPVIRVGDKAGCGAAISAGSPDVSA